ncbi:MAG: hypothetical protein RBG13Loki_3996 [Promethearchaeota archaeon CR_4]|nr:MAG: hypothetical protein RBG13Loki_3996 [Candidatus Lokiarchaeota archaeon CR_4]
MATPNIAFESGGDLLALFTRAMEKLGGLKNCLKENQPTIVAISMPFPEPAPVTTSFPLLRQLLQELKTLNLPQIQVCAVPDWGFNAQKVAHTLGISEFVKQCGAEFTAINQNGEAIPSNSSVKYPLYPLISKATNYISLPSIRFDPILGFFGACGTNYQFLFKPKKRSRNINFGFLLNRKKYSRSNWAVCEKNPEDIHKKFVDVILGSLSTRVPDLTVVDGSQVLVGQGPLLLTGGQPYSGNFLVAGNNPLAIDKCLAEKLGFKMDETLLLKEITQENLLDLQIPQEENTTGSSSSSQNPPPQKANNNLTSGLPSRLTVEQGKTCVLCQQNLRLLVDIMSNIGAKDLTYLEELNFISGIAPPQPPSLRNICLFGDCAINSTKKYEFHKIKQVKAAKKEKEKTPKKEKEKAAKKQKEKAPKEKKEKVSVKRNKSIVKIPGCPPSPLEVLQRLLQQYSGKNLPAVSFWLQVWKSLQNKSRNTLPKRRQGDGKP